jgi:predicted acetylornithine/succinylornithine family transaminase
VNTEENLDTQSVLQMDKEYVMSTYGRQPLVLVRGEGVYVWDADGRRYLDFLAGIAVNGLGHAHPAVVDAIRKQAGELMHVSNLYAVRQQPLLAKRLVELSGLGRAFFCNSGAEANEAAIKLARKWSKINRGEGHFGLITALHSFHGRTLGALTATGQPKYQKDFEPIVPGFSYVPYNDLDALKSAIDETTCAIMLEPIQGESGVRPATKEYLTGVRRLCDESGILLILDEVQTGLGRTGEWFAFQHYGIKPDIMTLAKTLGAGFPIGACLATKDVAAAFVPGNHAATFGGNPLACAAALATLDVMENDHLIENAAEMGAYFLDGLKKLKDERKDIVDVRGMGLMDALELSRDDAQGLVAKCREHGLLVNAIGLNTLRFLPPLIVKKGDVDNALEILREVLDHA